MQTPTPPKGTRDFYPEDMIFREHIFTTWEKTCQRYGFEKFDAPIFEHLEVYTQKSGEEIEKQLYTFKDKSGRQLALRPEMTPSLARMVALKGSSIKLPVRWYSLPRVLRYEKMQKGRLREFYQLNVDILGIAHVSADAELIAVAIDTMRDLGLNNNDFTVHISSRNLLEELFIHSGIHKDMLPNLYAMLDKRNKMSEEDFDQFLSESLPEPKLRKKIHSILQAQSLDEIRSIINSSEALAELDTLFVLMNGYGMTDYVKFDIGIVRGLAYYTGIVFELLDKNRSLRSIAGGGRYDRLVALYGGPETPAAGFATGDVVLSELLKEKGIVPEARSRSSIYIISLDRENPSKAIILAQKLRNEGISCEFALKQTGIGKQMKLADAARVKIVLFIGGDEEKEGKIKIRDMGTGNEQLVSADSIIEMIQKLL